MEATFRSEKFGVAIRIGLFIVLALLGIRLLVPILYPLGGYLIGAALGIFAAAAVANTIMIRIFERGRLADIGMNWHPGAWRNLLIGLGMGVAAALAVTIPPLLVGAAHLEPTPEQPASFASALFLSVVLIFGAVGEEMLFRGYGFQALMAHSGRFGAILPVGLLFGIAHGSNVNVTTLGIVVTVGFGIVLGYAFAQTGDLWLPIGIHFGWNWTLPLFGINLSGFTMGVTGYRMRWTVPDLWSGGAYGPEGSLLTVIIVVALFLWLRRVPVVTQVPYLIAKNYPEA